MKTILVVDDSASLRTVIRMTLEKEGYTILEAKLRVNHVNISDILYS